MEKQTYLYKGIELIYNPVSTATGETCEHELETCVATMLEEGYFEEQTIKSIEFNLKEKEDFNSVVVKIESNDQQIIPNGKYLFELGGLGVIW